MTRRILFFFLLAISSFAQPWPEGQFSDVSVFLPDNDPVELDGQMFLLPRGEYHYRVYIPVGYNASTQDYPCIFVIGSGARAAKTDAAKRAGKDKWIVVEIPGNAESNEVTSIAGFVCAHDDAMHKLRIRDGKKFVVGDAGKEGRAASLSGKRRGFGGALGKPGKMLAGEMDEATR
jgi:hypothetical protein